MTTQNPQDAQFKELLAKVEAALAEENAAKEAQARAFADANSATDERIKALEAQLAAQTQAAEALQKQLELQAVGQTLSEIHSFADGLVEGGKLPPALKPHVEALLSLTANLDEDVKSYALGDTGDLGEKSPFALVKDLLDALPVTAAIKPIGKSGKAAAAVDGTRGAVDMRRYSVDVDAANALHERIEQIRAEKGWAYVKAYELANAEINAQKR